MIKFTQNEIYSLFYECIYDHFGEMPVFTDHHEFYIRKLSYFKRYEFSKGTLFSFEVNNSQQDHFDLELIPRDEVLTLPKMIIEGQDFLKVFTRDDEKPVKEIGIPRLDEETGHFAKGEIRSLLKGFC